MIGSGKMSFSAVLPNISERADSLSWLMGITKRWIKLHSEKFWNWWKVIKTLVLSFRSQYWDPKAQESQLCWTFFSILLSEWVQAVVLMVSMLLFFRPTIQAHKDASFWTRKDCCRLKEVTLSSTNRWQSWPCQYLRSCWWMSTEKSILPWRKFLKFPFLLRASSNLSETRGLLYSLCWETWLTTTNRNKEQWSTTWARSSKR